MFVSVRVTIDSLHKKAKLLLYAVVSTNRASQALSGQRAAIDGVDCIACLNTVLKAGLIDAWAKASSEIPLEVAYPTANDNT